MLTLNAHDSHPKLCYIGGPDELGVKVFRVTPMMLISVARLEQKVISFVKFPVLIISYSLRI
jgi:hypothetical protein